MATLIQPNILNTKELTAPEAVNYVLGQPLTLKTMINFLDWNLTSKCFTGTIIDDKAVEKGDVIYIINNPYVDKERVFYMLGKCQNSIMFNDLVLRWNYDYNTAYNLALEGAIEVGNEPPKVAPGVLVEQSELSYLKGLLRLGDEDEFRERFMTFLEEDGEALEDLLYLAKMYSRKDCVEILEYYVGDETYADHAYVVSMPIEQFLVQHEAVCGQERTMILAIKHGLIDKIKYMLTYMYYPDLTIFLGPAKEYGDTAITNLFIR